MKRHERLKETWKIWIDIKWHEVRKKSRVRGRVGEWRNGGLKGRDNFQGRGGVMDSGGFRGRGMELRVEVGWAQWGLIGYGLKKILNSSDLYK